MRKTIYLSAVVLFVLAVAGCGGKPETPSSPESGTRAVTPGASPTKVVIGVLLPLSGPDAAKGQAMLAGLKLAVRQKGAPVGLDDNALEVRDCVAADADVLGLARALVDREGAGALVGPLGEKDVAALDEFCRQRKVPVLTPASGAMSLSDVGCTVRRLTFSDEEEGAAMARAAAAKGLRAAAVLVDTTSPASEARAKAFAEWFPKLGGHVATQVGYAAGERDFNRVVRMTAYAKPDVFYLTGARGESALILEQMKSQKVLGSTLGSSDWTASTDAEFPVEVGAGAAVYAPARFSAEAGGAAAREFASAFKQATQREPGVYEALGYDAGLILVDALLREGDLSERVGSIKLLDGATGKLTARPGSLAVRVAVMRLKGQSFAFDSAADIK
jgi:branched-chain amino acid transport system substrate-binding protein